MSLFGREPKSIVEQDSREDEFKKNSSQISTHLLLDPSMFASSFLEQTLLFINRTITSRELQIYIPAAFELFLRAEVMPNDKDLIRDFYQMKFNRHKIIASLEKYGDALIRYGVSETHGERFETLNNNLLHNYGIGLVHTLLIEEWVFMHEHSWIGAHSKAAFEAFKKSGAIAVEFGMKAGDELFDLLVKRPLHKKQRETLSKIEMLRVVAKYIAVSANTLNAFLDSPWTLPIMLGSDVFLLIDP